MATLHEVRSDSKLTWLGKKNIRRINKTPLSEGEQVIVSLVQRAWSLDTLVTMASLKRGEESVEVVQYLASPDDLDPIARWSIPLSKVNRDGRLNRRLFVLS